MKKTHFRFSKISKLYHFTNFESACQIIKGGKLRFRKSYSLNDLIESHKLFGNAPWEMIY